MVNLSTIYGVSIVLGSLAAVGSAIAGTKVYPIQTGGDPLAGPALLGATLTGAFAAAKKAIEPKPEPLATETVEQTEEPPAVEEPKIEEPKIEEPVQALEPPAPSSEENTSLEAST